MTPQNDNQIVELDRVSRQFDHKSAVSDISFGVSAGQIFGLIGPSGSGKSTLIHMMVGLLVPTSGEVRVFDGRPTELTTGTLARMGYMPQGLFLYPTLTAWENLSYVAALYGMGWFKKRRIIRQLLRQLGLWEARSKLAQDLSGGMMRRLQLGTVLVHNPELAFIDEPMEGLDPLLRQQVWNILQEMKSQGKTVIMTTHNMNEAERCDTLSLISNGELLATGAPDDLWRQAYGGEIARLLVETVDARVYAALRELPGVKQVNVYGGNDVRLTTKDAESTLSRAVEALRGLNIAVTTAEQYKPPFDDVFSRLVRRD